MSKLLNVVNKLLLGCLIYVIWQERNLRIFQSQFRSIDQICADIESTVGYKILSLRIRGRIFHGSCL